MARGSKRSEPRSVPKVGATGGANAGGSGQRPSARRYVATCTALKNTAQMTWPTSMKAIAAALPCGMTPSQLVSVSNDSTYSSSPPRMIQMNAASVTA
jgi:hypothetical protein